MTHTQHRSCPSLQGPIAWTTTWSLPTVGRLQSLDRKQGTRSGWWWTWAAPGQGSHPDSHPTQRATSGGKGQPLGPAQPLHYPTPTSRLWLLEGNRGWVWGRPAGILSPQLRHRPAHHCRQLLLTSPHLLPEEEGEAISKVPSVG